MPTYSFRCENCYHQWEEQRTIDDRYPPADGCPLCTNENVVRVFTPTPTFFRGSGFYTTDYRGKR